MVPTLLGCPHTEPNGNAAANLTAVEVGLDSGTFRLLQGIIVESGGIAVQIQKSISEPVLSVGFTILGHGQIHTLGQKTYCIGIGEILDIHDEIDNATALFAAETVIILLVLQNMEGGRFFIVEWTAAPIAPTLRLQRHIAAHHIQYVISSCQLVQKALGKGHVSASFLCCCTESCNISSTILYDIELYFPLFLKKFIPQFFCGINIDDYRSTITGVQPI